MVRIPFKAFRTISREIESRRVELLFISVYFIYSCFRCLLRFLPHLLRSILHFSCFPVLHIHHFFFPLSLFVFPLRSIPFLSIAFCLPCLLVFIGICFSYCYWCIFFIQYTVCCHYFHFFAMLSVPNKSKQEKKSECRVYNALILLELLLATTKGTHNINKIHCAKKCFLHIVEISWKCHRNSSSLLNLSR